MGTIALSDLYGLLLQPLEAALGVRQRLIVIPDGELHKVPFAALRTQDGRYLAGVTYYEAKPVWLQP